MEWEPSEKMTVDDLKAVLMSWRIEIPKKPNKEMLQKLVAKEFKAIMQRIYGYAPIVKSVRPVASSSCAASDKSVGTDLPAMVTSYIGSEAGSEHDSVIVENTRFTKLIINDLSDRDTPACVAPSAACAAEVEHVAEPEVAPSAACAAEVEHVPSLRRAVEMEILATAKAKMAKMAKMAKKVEKVESLRSAVENETMSYTQAETAKDIADAKKAAKKKAAKLYAYLPIGATFIDEDQKKKDGDKDSGDIVV